MVDLPESKADRERRVASTLNDIAEDFAAFVAKMTDLHPLLEVNVGLALRESDADHGSAALAFALSTNCAGALTVAAALLHKAMAQAKRAGMPRQEVDHAIDIALKNIREVTW